MAGMTGGFKNLGTMAKPGVFQPVTGQAVVTATTCVDDRGANEALRKDVSKTSDTKYRGSPRDNKIGQRVETHLLALRKKEGGGIQKRRFRNQRGSGAAMKIFTFLNNRVITDGNLDNFHDQYEHVGVVQTAINPDDRTKPEGFRTCATRIGGTVSLVHTGDEFIPANTPVFWQAPELSDKPLVIKGMPEDAVYPLIKAYSAETLSGLMADAIITDNTVDVPGVVPTTRRATIKGQLKTILKKKLSVWSRVIGWTLNDCEPGHQMDLILKR